MKFIADEMLGKLARWMRFMGLDVIHRSPFPDEEIMKLAQSDARTILTRDRGIIEGLHKKQVEGAEPVRVIAIKEDLPFDQLYVVVREAGIDPLENAFTRCAECNGALVDRKKEEVTGRVPPFIYANIAEYRQCTGCGKVYWSGSHRARIENILREVSKRAAAEAVKT